MIHVTVKGELAKPMALALQERDKRINHVVRRITRGIHRHWGQRMRKNTYRLVRSRRWTMAKPKLGIVYTTMDYAPFEEFDTRPHTLTAAPGKMLRFQVNGRLVFRKSVRHPGTRGSHALRDAVRGHALPLRTQLSKALK